MITYHLLACSTVLTKNGDTDGIGTLTVADASKIRPGSICNISSATEVPVFVLIIGRNGHVLLCREVEEYKPNSNAAPTSMARFHTGDTATLVQTEQWITIPDILEVPTEQPIGESKEGAAQMIVANATQIIAANPARKAVIVQNLGPNELYIGFSSTLTSATGIQVAKNGGTFTIIGTQAVYGITVNAIQVTPLDTRYSEIFS